MIKIIKINCDKIFVCKKNLFHSFFLKNANKNKNPYNSFQLQ